MGRPMQQKKRGSMFFDNMVRDFGEDFMSKVRPNDIMKKSHFLFKDIAHGNLNVEKHGRYFLDGNFTTILKNASWQKRFYYMTHCNGLELIKLNLPANAADPLFQDIERADRESLQAYSIIDDGLNAIMATGDISILTIMMNNIKPFRYAV